MTQRTSCTVFRIVSVVLLVAVLAGCAGLPVRTRPYTAGSVLVLPPRDVVQGGRPHPKGIGSGRALMEFLVTRFAGTPFEAVTTRSKAFNHIETAAKEKALAEAKRLKADYCLQLALGEFRNAAPFSFRTDYVYLSQGVMYDVADGQEVWRITSPLYREKENVGNHFPLLEAIARIVVRSVVNEAAKAGKREDRGN